MPILLRRIAQRVAPRVTLQLPRPIRVKKQRVLKAGELERTVELAARQARPAGSILILLDANGDCPGQMAPEVMRRAIAARQDRAIRVVLATREYEAWFLAATRSQRYRETLHQPSLTAIFDLEASRAAPSFDKLWRDVAALVGVVGDR